MKYEKKTNDFCYNTINFCLGLFSIYHIRKSNRYLYKIAYFDKSIPGHKYDIEIFNNKVEYIRTNFCSTENCKESTNEKVTLKYTKANIQKIKDYLGKRYDSKEIVIKEYEDNYDIEKLISNIDDRLENILSTYNIKTKNNVYAVNDNNEEMNDFLNDLHLTLSICLEEQ